MRRKQKAPCGSQGICAPSKTLRGLDALCLGQTLRLSPRHIVLDPTQPGFGSQVQRVFHPPREAAFIQSPFTWSL